MSRCTKFSERIGAVYIPVADDIIGDEADVRPNPNDADPTLGLLERRRLPVERTEWRRELIDPWWFRFRFCSTNLTQGCYTLSFTPKGANLLSTRYRGTLRVEKRGSGYRISGDLYRYRRIALELVLRDPQLILRDPVLTRLDTLETDEAADAPSIPIYKRADYQSYLKGVAASMFSASRFGSTCTFTLTFDEHVYNHPATGFEGSFNAAATRTIRYVFNSTPVGGLYSGEAFVGTTKIGTVSMRHVSSFYRRATLQIHTLAGAVPPPTVGTTYFDDIFADTGWDLTVNDGGTVPMPATITGQSKTQCWSTPNLHRLMASVTGYDPADLDTVWRSHLVAVQAKLGCSRGVMFDSSGDLNDIAREGSATFSDDGYNVSHSSNFGAAENEKQRDVPRAFLRSAAHEVGHAFNQIHQELETSADNSIMTTTPSVANVLASAGQTFPDDIALAFNATVKQHLKHLPDPAVRPGAMGFFGGAINAPEPADVAFLETLEVTVQPASDRVRLGEPLEVKWKLTNKGGQPVPVPSDLEHRALVSRVSVTDPDGNVTFLRPIDQHQCSHIPITDLAAGKSISGSAVVFYGRDGFTMQRPGLHTVTVIVLWHLAGQPVAASGEAQVHVGYPVSDTDNKVAALLLDADVGRAVALGGAKPFKRAQARISEATKASPSHPACKAVKRLTRKG